MHGRPPGHMTVTPASRFAAPSKHHQPGQRYRPEEQPPLRQQLFLLYQPCRGDVSSCSNPLDVRHLLRLVDARGPGTVRWARQRRARRVRAGSTSGVLSMVLSGIWAHRAERRQSPRTAGRLPPTLSGERCGNDNAAGVPGASVSRAVAHCGDMNYPHDAISPGSTVRPPPATPRGAWQLALVRGDCLHSRRDTNTNKSTSPRAVHLKTDGPSTAPGRTPALPGNAADADGACG